MVIYHDISIYRLNGEFIASRSYQHPEFIGRVPIHIKIYKEMSKIYDIWWIILNYDMEHCHPSCIWDMCLSYIPMTYRSPRCRRRHSTEAFRGPGEDAAAPAPRHVTNREVEEMEEIWRNGRCLYKEIALTCFHHFKQIRVWRSQGKT